MKPIDRIPRRPITSGRMSEPQKKKQAPNSHEGRGAPGYIATARAGDTYQDLDSGFRYVLTDQSDGWRRVTTLVIDPLYFDAKLRWGLAAKRAHVPLITWIIQTLNKAAREE